MTQPRNVTPWVVALSCGVALSTAGCNLLPSQEGSSDTASEWVDGPSAGTSSGELLANNGGSNIEQLVARAKAAEAAGDLQEGRNLFQQALALDPNHPDAQLGQNRINANLGMRFTMSDVGGGSEDIGSTASEITQVRRDQMRMEAETNIQQGDVAMSAGDYDTAIERYEKALMIVQHNPFLEGTGLTEEGVQNQLDGAKTAKIEYDRQEQSARQQVILREKTEREQEAQAALANKIVILFKSANSAFQNDRYGEAETYLTEILRLDPANAEAENMRRMARDAARHALDTRNTREMKLNWRRNFDELSSILRPQMNTVEFAPEHEWRTIADRGPIEFSVAEDLSSPEERAILDKLTSTPVTMAFDDVPLVDALDWFKTLTSVNFIVSPAIIDSGDDYAFTINTPAMPALDALQLLLRIADPPLKYRVKDGVVNVLGADEPIGNQVLEIYDIRDLTLIVNNFPVKDFNLSPSGFETDDFGDDDTEPAPPWEGSRLQELIETNIAPDSWTTDPANSVLEIAGSLVVRQTPEVHRMIRRLLDDLRENMGTLINIESRFITVTDSFLEDIGVDFRGLGPDSVNPEADIPNGLTLDDFGSIPDGFGTPTQPSGTGTDNDVGYFDQFSNGDIKARTELLYDTVLGNNEFTNAGGLSLQGTFLDDTLSEIVLRAVSKYGMSNITDAPALTLYNNQRANISMINHVSYVSDFDVEIAQAAVIGQPVVKVLQEGVVLDVRPVVSADKRFITMELRPTVADLKRPIDTFTTSLSIGSDVTIELPILRIKRARTTVTMPDGSTLMLGGWKLIEDQDFESGIPFLSKVPLLTAIFTRKGKFLDKRKLLILVKAKVVIPEEHEPTYGLGR